MIIVPYQNFELIKKLKINNFKKAEIIAIFCRINTLTMIKIAGSGHLGTSMSALDLFVWIKHFQFPTKKNLINDKNRNIFFSSKGHDAPGLYSVLFSLGIIKLNKLLKLRKLNGLDGHPDISIKGIEANTGSLGMGISKGKGIMWAKKYLNQKGKVIVLTGDGEFQEGQIYEALQTTSHQKINDLIVIIDHNKIQSSEFVKKIIDLKDLKKKISSFGWHVERCNGHSFRDLKKIFSKFETIKNKPKLLIADTIKGKGIDSIEHPKVMKKNKFYNWHSGAPSDELYDEMIATILKKTKKKLKESKIDINPFAVLDGKSSFYKYKSTDIH
jgi:transketolase